VTAISPSVARPTPVSQRLELLDAIRGVALGGILLANLMSFFGADMVAVAERRSMAAGAAGEVVLFGINWLVEGKFYSIFSILFGIGFALQCSRFAAAGDELSRFSRFFRRRMTVLIAIGLTHMFGLWSGDILTLYGVMGLVLPSVMRWPRAGRTSLMLALFCIPFLTHAMVVASDGRLNPRAPFAELGQRVRAQLAVDDRPALDVFARSNGRAYWAWNASFAVARPGTYLQSGRPAKVLALFLLGVWIGVTVLPRVTEHRGRLAAAAVGGGAVGLVASFVYASIKAETGSTFLVSSTGLLQTAAYTVGTTPLALAYMSAAALAWRSKSLKPMLEWFVPLGRMALSVYLSQTIVQMILFTGVGLGLAGRLSLAWLPIVAAAMLIAQRQTCRWWLARRRQGPIEMIWRRATYGSGAGGGS
jgi:uncharacterized protein